MGPEMTNPKEPAHLAASPSTEGAPVPPDWLATHKKLVTNLVFEIGDNLDEVKTNYEAWVARVNASANALSAHAADRVAPVPAQQAAEGFALRNMATTLGLWLPWVTEPGPKTLADIDAFAAMLRQAQYLLASQPPSPQPPLPVVAVAEGHWQKRSPDGQWTAIPADTAWQEGDFIRFVPHPPVAAQPEQPQSIYQTSDCVACASKTALPEGMPHLLEQAATALEGALNEAGKNVCLHEETYRGGAIWEICRACGAKWADDEGGKPPHEEPARITRGYETLAALRAHLSLRIAPKVDAQQEEDAARLDWLTRHISGHALRQAGITWSAWSQEGIRAAIDRARSLASAATKKGD